MNFEQQREEWRRAAIARHDADQRTAIAQGKRMRSLWLFDGGDGAFYRLSSYLHRVEAAIAEMNSPDEFISVTAACWVLNEYLTDGPELLPNLPERARAV